MQHTAFVGCAHIHTPGFVKRINAREDVSVKFVWDHDRDRAQKNSRDLDAETVSDLSEIWSDPDITSVVICSETNLHEELVLAATAAKKHLFVEKPLGIGASDSYKMARAIDEAGVTFQTGYFHRGFTANQFLYNHIKQGTFGTITRIRLSNCHHGSLSAWFDAEWGWMADPRQAGVGAFGDMGTHVLDLMLWFMGDVEDVTADIKVVTGRYGDCDESGEGMLRFKDGATGTLSAGWVDVANPVTHIVSGTRGHFHVIGRDQVYVKCDDLDGADGTTLWTDLPRDLPHAFELFFDVLQGKDAPLVTAQEAATRSAVMAAMYQASEQRTWIKPTIGK